MFERRIIATEDGSSSMYVEGLNEQYHSIHGAVQESMHVFIKYGLDLCEQKSVSILEIGFGTGLNAFLTLVEAKKKGLKVIYHSIEKYPLQIHEYSQLQFGNAFAADKNALFLKLHDCEWESAVAISPDFTLTKTNVDLEDWNPTQKYDLIYFDAFAPDKQPNLWTESIFKKLYDSLNDGGILSTYCAKGQVKRNLKAAGFTIEPKPGPIGKREITVAKKMFL
jgi:tRNA U34 5-methylaminomethyl-2-thiouridine-forming methyltransferase MnmC